MKKILFSLFAVLFTTFAFAESTTTITLDDIVNGQTSTAVALGTNSYGSQATAADSTWYTCTVGEIDYTGCRIGKASSDYGSCLQFQGNASDATKQGFFGNTTGIQGITKIVITAYVLNTAKTVYAPAFNVYAGSEALPNGTAATDSTMTMEVDGTLNVWTITYNFNSKDNPSYFAIRNDKVGVLYVNSIAITHGGSDTPTEPQLTKPTISPNGGELIVDKDGNVPTITLSTPDEGENIYIRYTFDDESYATYANPISLTAEGYKVGDVVTLKAATIVMDPEEGEIQRSSGEASAKFTLVPAITNTPETAYTTTEAVDIIKAGVGLSQSVYVKGIISQVDSYNSKYGSITYWISEDGATTDQFEVYGGLNIDSTKFAAKEDIEVGAKVVVYGKIKAYNTVNEFDKNNYLISYVAPPAYELTFDPLTATTQNIAGYAKDKQKNNTELSGAQPVEGWTVAEGCGDDNGDGVAAGIFAYGSEPMLCGGSKAAPATNQDGEAGNALGMLAVWGQKIQYTTEIKLAPGIYKMVVPTYNSQATGSVNNLTGITIGDKTYTSTTTSFTGSAWTTQTIEQIIVEETTTATISLGYQSKGNGSAANPHIFIDGVQLFKTGTEADILGVYKQQAIDELKALPTTTTDELFKYNESDIEAAITAIESAKSKDEIEDYANEPELNKPIEGKPYQLKNTTAAGNLGVTEGKVSITADAIVMFEETANGFLIKNVEGQYIYKTTANNWTLSTTANAAEAYVLTPTVAEGGYTLNGSKGAMGTDSTEEGAIVYADKNASKNGVWTIELYNPETHILAEVDRHEAELNHWTRAYTVEGEETGNFQRNTWSGENDESGMKTPFLESWVWGGNGAQLSGETFTHSTITNLPEGEYEISLLVRAFNEKAGSETPSGITMTVNETSVKMDDVATAATYNNMAELYANLAVPTTVGADGNLNIRLEIEKDGMSWLAFKNLVIKRVFTEAPELTAAEGAMNKDIEAAQKSALAAYITTPNQETYEAALAAIEAAEASVAEYADIATKLATLDEDGKASFEASETGKAYADRTLNGEDTTADLAAAAKAQTTKGANMTLAIVNNSFEKGNTDGWNTTASSDTGARDNNNGTYHTEGADGNWVFNTWWQGTPCTQTITGLPNGRYKLTALVASDGATVYLTANGEHNEGTETGGTYPSGGQFQTAELEFVVTDGTATIGVVGGANGTAGEHKDYVEEGYWWYKADNFQLTYLAGTIVDMTISDAQYATFCAPYDVYVPEGVKIYTTSATEENGYTLVLEEYEDDLLSAGMAVILYSETHVNKKYADEPVELTSEPVCGWLHGVFQETPAEDGWYLLQNHDGDLGFWQVQLNTAQPVVPANRCYLLPEVSSEQNGIKGFTFNANAETAIQTINALTSGKSEIYDLNGRRLNGMQKGVNIINGKKVLVK